MERFFMLRYFFEIAYDGSDFVGWQSQPNGLSVQESIETQLAILLQYPCTIVGCGRTDAGVHASQYYFHADFQNLWTDNLTYRLNLMLPKSISVHRVLKVDDGVHARFDAQQRSYEYKIHSAKSPFVYRYSTYLPLIKEDDFDKLQSFAQIFTDYEEFYPFCKSNSDVKTYRCKIGVSRWVKKEEGWMYEISADRFLRGMVRLIVGAQLNLLKGKITTAELISALRNQEKMEHNYAVPPQGLHLSKIDYPFISG
jgi:tRNA pseudouridine38-40 synthase